MAATPPVNEPRTVNENAAGPSKPNNVPTRRQGKATTRGGGRTDGLAVRTRGMLVLACSSLKKRRRNQAYGVRKTRWPFLSHVVGLNRDMQ